MSRPYFATFLSTCALCLFAGCGSDSTDREVEATEAVPVDNVARTTRYFGQNGSLWKPRGDDHGRSPGALVVLLGSEFATQFDSCEVRLNTGETVQLIGMNNVPWTHTPYSCFANGNRQHWRASFRCENLTEVKVVCRMPNVETTFTVSDAQRGQVCSRFS